MNKKVMFIALTVFVLLAGTAVYAAQGYFNPNSVTTDISSDKKVISEVLKILEKNNKGSAKSFTENDFTPELVFKLYYIDEKKILDGSVNDFDSLLLDYNLDYVVYVSGDKAAATSVTYAMDSNDGSGKKPVAFDNIEGARISRLYEEQIKGKEFDDIKIIAHPAHECNKLFYITENGKKYIIPSIVKGKEDSVGLKSGQKYTVDEILKNVVDFVKSHKDKGLYTD